MTNKVQTGEGVMNVVSSLKRGASITQGILKTQ